MKKDDLQNSSPRSGAEGGGTVSPENCAATERLRQAVAQAGGPQAVARRSGVPFGSIRHYLSGRDIKAPALVAIADACGVSIEWLAAGRGAMRPLGEQVATPEHQPAPESSNLFGTLDIDRMARAVEKALDLFAERDHRPSMRRLAQVILLVYDDFVDPSQPKSRASDMIVHNEGDTDATC